MPPFAPFAAAVLIAVCAGSVGGLLFAEARDAPMLKRIFKPAASIAFVLLALASGAMQSPFGLAILGGLVLCAIGDILLIPKGAATFLAGMGAFAAGHAAYIGAFAVGGVEFSLAALAGGAVVAAAGMILVSTLWRTLGSFRAPVIAYTVIIAVMVAAAMAHFTAAPGPEAGILVAAAAGFAVSDISVALDRFGKAAFINRLWGLPLYYAAQILFALSV